MRDIPNLKNKILLTSRINLQTKPFTNPINRNNCHKKKTQISRSKFFQKRNHRYMSLSNHSSPISLSNPLKTSESRGKNFISSHLPPEKKERRGEKKDDTKQRPIATDTMALVKSTISVDVSPRLISNVDERERERKTEKEREKEIRSERGQKDP